MSDVNAFAWCKWYSLYINCRLCSRTLMIMRCCFSWSFPSEQLFLISIIKSGSLEDFIVLALVGIFFKSKEFVSKLEFFIFFNLEAISVLFFGDFFFMIATHHHPFNGQIWRLNSEIILLQFFSCWISLVGLKGKKKTLFHLKCINDAKFLFQVVILWLPIEL